MNKVDGKYFSSFLNYLDDLDRLDQQAELQNQLLKTSANTEQSPYIPPIQTEMQYNNNPFEIQYPAANPVNAIEYSPLFFPSIQTTQSNPYSETRNTEDESILIEWNSDKRENSQAIKKINYLIIKYLIQNCEKYEVVFTEKEKKLIITQKNSTKFHEKISKIFNISYANFIRSMDIGKTIEGYVLDPNPAFALDKDSILKYINNQIESTKQIKYNSITSKFSITKSFYAIKKRDARSSLLESSMTNQSSSTNSQSFAQQEWPSIRPVSQPPEDRIPEYDEYFSPPVISQPLAQQEQPSTPLASSQPQQERSSIPPVSPTPSAYYELLASPSSQLFAHQQEPASILQVSRATYSPISTGETNPILSIAPEDPNRRKKIVCLVTQYLVQCDQGKLKDYYNLFIQNNEETGKDTKAFHEKIKNIFDISFQIFAKSMSVSEEMSGYVLTESWIIEYINSGRRKKPVNYNYIINEFSRRKSCHAKKL